MGLVPTLQASFPFPPFCSFRARAFVVEVTLCFVASARLGTWTRGDKSTTGNGTTPLSALAVGRTRNGTTPLGSLAVCRTGNGTKLPSSLAVSRTGNGTTPVDALAVCRTGNETTLPSGLTVSRTRIATTEEGAHSDNKTGTATMLAAEIERLPRFSPCALFPSRTSARKNGLDTISV